MSGDNKPILVYGIGSGIGSVIGPGIGLAIGAVVLEWMQYQHIIYQAHHAPTEAYVVAIAALFTGFGVWIGVRLNSLQAKPPEFKSNPDERARLQISERESEVLVLLAEGLSNKEIADQLFVSPNTVKTHLNHLYQKLAVSRRTQAVKAARSLQLIP